MNKAELRSLMRTRLRNMDAPTALSTGQAIARRLPELTGFDRMRRICIYCSVDREVATGPMIARCLQTGKKLCVPFWNRQSRVYALAEFSAATRLKRGPLGIPEPAEPDPVDPAEVDLALVPGLAFDRQGGRLGHGGGHFDRLLADCSPGCLFAGMAFDEQVIPAVPMQEHDVRLHLIMTQTHTWDCESDRPNQPHEEDNR